MKRAIAFIKEQRVVVARWVQTDMEYMAFRVKMELDPDEGVATRLSDRTALLHELDDVIETLEDT
jgi:hypothetical protein